MAAADLEDPDARIPGQRYAALWEAVAARDPRARLRLARHWRIEMAGVVGYVMATYSEPSAFHRAFRRWTGTTPQAFREWIRPG